MLSLLDDFRVCNDMGPVMEVWSGEGPLVFGFCAGDTSSAHVAQTRANKCDDTVPRIYMIDCRRWLIENY